MDRIRKLIALTVCLAALLGGCAEGPATPTTTETTAPTFATVAEADQEVPPTTLPEPEEYVLTFAGDCTLGTEHGSYNGSGTFVRLVGDDYEYPFENVKHFFEGDDFTLVNLEGTFTEYNVPREKRFRFRAPLDYAKILSLGSVEAVTLANNHSMDYGETGYADTKKALETENISYVEDRGTTHYTTPSGLKIGMYAGQFDMQVSDIQAGIQKLRQEGAEIVIACFHWGKEGSYRPTDQQKAHAYAAIDAGADIVVGHHPHVLQPIEEYGGGIIYYSLGNFSFGGNRNPRDKDSVVLQQTVIRESDGTLHLGTLKRIPVRVSSKSSYNDYKPTPYDEDTKEYNRALSKLDGSFKGKDLVVSYAKDEEEEEPTTPATQPEQEQTPVQPEQTTPPTQPEQTEPPQTQPKQEEAKTGMLNMPVLLFSLP